MANEIIFTTSGDENYAEQVEGVYEDTGWFKVGKQNISGTDYTFNGALRFTGINIAKNTTVNSAELKIYKGSNSDNSNNVYIKVWGIDEDNTGTFGNPFGRTKTTATNTHNTYVNTGSYFTIEIGSVVNEILSRSGWSSGNAMGFLVEDNGSSVGAFLSEGPSGTNSFLSIRATAEPNFKPTPKSVAAPTFPTSEDMGIRISKPGYDVLTNLTRKQFHYTSREKIFQVYEEGEVTLSGGTATITHNLGYNPVVLAYANHSGKKYRFPDFFSLTDGGNIYTNKTQAIIQSSADKVYYYIFIEPIELI